MTTLFRYARYRYYNWALGHIDPAHRDMPDLMRLVSRLRDLLPEGLRE